MQEAIYQVFHYQYAPSKRLRIIIRRSKSQNGNAKAIANNHDLLTQFLVHLPVKSLLQFKSVSKAWHSLISDFEFSRRLFPHISGLIMPNFDSAVINIEHGFIPLGCKSSTDAPFKFLTFINHPSGLKVVQACNGLMLCRSFRDFNFHPDYYIYNPTTKQFATLPLPANQKTRYEFRMSLAFDPTKSPHCKVVCVRDPDPRLEIKNDPDSSYTSQQVEIYSSQTRSWRVSGKPFMAAVNAGFHGGVFCNGAIHWLNTWDPTLNFNVEDEKLGELPMPAIPDDCKDTMCKYFGESRGHLHFIEIYRPRTTMFKVYEIESDYSGWFVKYHIDLYPLTVAFPGMIRTYYDPSDLNYYLFSVLCIVREANDEDSYMVLHIPDKAIQYNLKDGSFKKICDFDPDDENDNPGSPALISLKYFRAYQFIQTLSSV